MAKDPFRGIKSLIIAETIAEEEKSLKLRLLRLGLKENKAYLIQV